MDDAQLRRSANYGAAFVEFLPIAGWVSGSIAIVMLTGINRWWALVAVIGLMLWVLMRLAELIMARLIISREARSTDEGNTVTRL